MVTCLALTGGSITTGILISLNSSESCLALTVPLPIAKKSDYVVGAVVGKLGTSSMFSTSSGKSWTW